MSEQNDYARTPVPDTATVGWYNIALIILGIGITLPVFLVGSELTLAQGIPGALGVFALSGAVVGVLLALTSLVGARTRLSTYMILEFCFGRTGAKLVNLIMAVVLVAWFAFTAEILGVAVADALRANFAIDLPVPLYTLSGGVLMTLTAIFGFHVMERFSQIAVPLLALFMLYVLYLALQQGDVTELLAKPGNGSMSFGVAVSTVIGTNILMAVMAPDLTRFARTDRDALLSISGLVIGYPLVMLASGLPSLVLGEVDIMKIMMGLGLSAVALVILVLSTWTTNTVNLYSSILTLSTIATRARGWVLGVVAAAAGLAATLGGVMEHFFEFVILMGVAATPVAGIYIADFFLIRRQSYQLADLEREPAIKPAAFIAWGLGTLIGYLGSADLLTLSSIPALDSVTVAFLAYWGLARIGHFSRGPALPR
ncbi:cytosine permease [Microbulbifer sp. CAU 1566]|uniref:cytosine permease n=1 Tax=Microbulbifer sp. CAU 1566 TaxID=2933269 RepID=UPI00200316C2|nr:cytosine permease [Microbulbifer sp. CAU 1566]MCK7597669.1 cytosine permease [Microbulbifer sp. CAU 1566]